MSRAYIDTTNTNQRDEYVVLEDFKLQRDWSRFGGQTNPSGRLQYYMEIAITDPEIAQFLTDNEYPVKVWVPNRDNQESVPETHMKVMLPYDNDPRKAWLTPVIKTFNVNGGEGVDITRETVAELDNCDIDHVNMRLRKFKGKNMLGGEYVHAQLVYGEFYITGKKENSRANLSAPIEGAQSPKDDLPFDVD